MSLREDFLDAYQSFKDEKLHTAETKIAKIIEKNPPHPDVLALGAIIARGLKDYRLGFSRINQALEHSPNNHEYINTLANLESDLGHDLRAEKSYKRALSIEPDFHPAMRSLAFHYLEQKQPQHSIPLFEALILSSGPDPKLLLGVSQAYKETLRYEDALRTLDNLPTEFRRDPNCLITIAHIYFQMNRLEESLEASKQILNANIQHPLAFLNVVQIYKMNGEHQKIEDLILRLILIPTLAPETLSQIFSVCLTLDRFSLAETVVERFSSQNNLFGVTAAIEHKKGHHLKAVANAKRHLETNSDDLGVLSVLAQSALCVSDMDLAKYAVEKGFSLAPMNQYWIAMQATLSRKLGLSYRDIYNYDQFVSHYDIFESEEISELIALKNFTTDLHKYSEEPINQSLRSGTQTSEDLRFMKAPVMNDFFKRVDKAISDYMSKIGHSKQHPLLVRNQSKHRFAGVWSVRLSGTGHHVNHVHPEGWISGAFYLEVPENTPVEKAGWLKLGEPSFDIGLGPEAYVEPKPGRLALFPSYMWHGTIPISEKDTRTTISFDVVPAP